MNLDTIEIIGYIAAFSTTFAFLPQTIKVFKTKDTSGLSLSMYSVFIFGIAMWLVYGILLTNWPIIIANAFTLTLAGIILLLIVTNKRKTT